MTAESSNPVQAISKGQIRRSGKLAVRKYRPEDEEAVRDICYATGFLGRPVTDWIDVNRELFTDLWLTYYLQIGPEAIFVAVREGKVVGYLTGCLDSRQHKRFQDRRLPWILLGRFLCGRYRFGRRAVALALRALRDAIRFGFPKIPLQDYPAHLHYNVRDGNRGTVERCGIHLLDAFCGHMARNGVTRCHGLMVVPRGDVDRRYRSLGKVHDRCRTTLYRPADPRDLEMICRVFDLSDISTRYAKYVAMALPDAPAPQADNKPAHIGVAGRMLQAGLMLAGIATAMVLPGLPLRLSAPALLLFLAALSVRSGKSVTLTFLVTAYTWFWMVACILSSRGTPWYPMASLGLAVGFMLSLPATSAGRHKKSSLPATVHMGVAAGLLVFLLAGGGLALAGPETIPFDLPGLILLAVGAVLAYLAALSGIIALPARALRRCLLFPLALGVAAVLLVTGAWQLAARRANHDLAKGNHEDAIAWALREGGWARSLGLQWARSHALHRQAEIHKASTQLAQWYDLQSEAAILAPRDMAMRQELFRFALKSPGKEHDAIIWFMQLPDAQVAKADAQTLVDIVLETKVWSQLARALRLAGGALPDQPHMPVDWAEAGSALAASDSWPAAAVLLRRAMQSPSPRWNTVRLFCVAMLETGDPAGITEALEGYTTGAHANEAAYLLALAAQATGELNEKQAALLASPDPAIRVNDRLMLTACKLDDSAAEAGEVLQLAISWRAIGPVPASWRVFVHIRQAVYGGTFFQADHRFDDMGQRPETWPIGSPLTYSIPIQIPASAPPGTYRVIVGVWDGKDNQPLSAAPSAPFTLISHNRILVGSLKVE